MYNEDVLGAICARCNTVYRHDPIPAERISESNGVVRYCLSRPQVCPVCHSEASLIDIVEDTDTLDLPHGDVHESFYK